ncbi:GerAB/ArcD/ProY family transporter [Alteribacter natronophilus]|uniref:GerAB/ArcD/ProY family transporter n=1 Tax=Alteribacter natronophilus TaxID=2583810 RepID=UPI00110D6F2A|nr:endospore germination permease [Alteribacter natronophilus]TMW72962.1 hypothetical protein FGB90_01230 [Alteribacter natronophilus]
MKNSINRWQFGLLIINFIVGSSLLMAPTAATSLAGEGAWLSMLLATGAGVTLNVLLYILLRKYRFASVYVISELVTGKIAGTLLNILFICAVLHLTSLIMRNFANFTNTVALTETSSHVVVWMPIVLMIFSVSKGVQNIGRVNEVLLPLMLTVVIGTLLLVLNNFETSHLVPLFEDGLFPLVHGAYPILGFPFIEMLVFTALATFVTDKKHLITYTAWSIGISGIILALAIVVTIGVESTYFASRETYATYSMARNIEIGELFQRVEAAIGIVWLLSLFIKMTVCLLGVLLGLQHISKKDGYGAFIFPCAVLVWAMSHHLHPDIVDFSDFVLKNWTLYWGAIYIVMTGVLMTGILLGKHRKITHEGNRLSG